MPASPRKPKTCHSIARRSCRVCGTAVWPDTRHPGRHLVSGRAVRQDPGAATVSVAGRGRGRDVLDILVQSRRNRRAAKRFFRKLLKRQGREPRRLITDKLRSYSAAHRTVVPSVIHSTRQYENNRAEVSHQPTRQRERQMRRFKSAAHLQRFASVHGVVQNLFRVGRHLLGQLTTVSWGPLVPSLG